jgi:hypothetical protein
MDDSKLTLTALLQLKERRERKIRSEITRLEKELAANEQMRGELLQIRQDLWHQWRQCGDEEKLLDPLEWRAYRVELARYYQYDHDLMTQLETARTQSQALEIQKDAQQQLLRQSMMEQEKLKIMMEE